MVLAYWASQDTLDHYVKDKIAQAITPRCWLCGLLPLLVNQMIEIRPEYPGFPIIQLRALAVPPRFHFPCFHPMALSMD
jgi:hypothetical protein